MEPAIAELAALAARKPDLDYMQHCMQQREKASRLDEYEHWDYELHMSIARATHNSLLIELLDLVNRMRRTASWRKFRVTSTLEEQRRTSNAQHRAIVQAICEAHPEGAFSAMRMHVDFVSGRYQQYADDGNAAARRGSAVSTPDQSKTL